jgi:hypothetical protein
MTWAALNADNTFQEESLSVQAFDCEVAVVSFQDGGSGNECLLTVDDLPDGNECSYTGLRLTIIADPVQEPRL